MADFFVHDLGRCESVHVGTGTRIWAYAHVLAGARIGADCNVCDHVFVENDVVVGDRVTLKCGVQLWDGLTIEEDVFVGPNATFANDLFPRSKERPAEFLKTRVCRGASIGANATILPGITIGQHAMIAAGAVVTKSVPAFAIVRGNPARISGYTHTPRRPSPTSPGAETTSDAEVTHTKVAGVTIHRMPLIPDLRGTLSVGEVPKDVPFEVRRYFVVFDVKSSEIRGEHAHRRCHQFLVCVRGRVSVVADDGTQREQIDLAQPNLGIHVPPMIWTVQYLYSPDAVLLVLASESYDPADYIRDYDEFLSLV